VMVKELGAVIQGHGLAQRGRQRREVALPLLDDRRGGFAVLAAASSSRAIGSANRCSLASGNVLPVTAVRSFPWQHDLISLLHFVCELTRITSSTIPRRPFRQELLECGGLPPIFPNLLSASKRSERSATQNPNATTPPPLAVIQRSAATKDLSSMSRLMTR
jgi:hypothetical protein